MTVNNVKLVDLLVQKTGLEKEQVEEQLHQFIERIQAEVEKNGTFKVAGLGEFSLRDGGLYFTAEENLATEINHNYAGMKPIELIGAFKDKPDASVSEEQEESDAADSVFGIEEYREETTHQEEPGEDLGADAENKTEEPKETPPEPEIKENTPSFKLDEEIIEIEEQHPKHEAAATSRQKAFEPKKKRESKDTVGKMLVTAVIVIALGVSGWLAYDMGFLDIVQGTISYGNNFSEGRTAGNLNAVQNETGRTGKDNNAGSDSDPAAGGGSTGEETSEQDQAKPISNITDIAEESRQSIYGLRGGAAPKAKDGYTIVIHSLRNEAKVRSLNEELQQEGYRTIVYSASVRNITFWRLGLGQFKTVKDATEAASTLPDPYKSNHFVKRIQ